jgi:hypothetical protein
MASQWIEDQCNELAIDSEALSRFARKEADDQDRLVFYAELMVKSLHRIEYLQYANAGVEMEDV